MSERRFTLEEAQRLLDERVREMAERMVAERKDSRTLESRWNTLVITIGSNGGDLRRTEVAALRESLESAHASLRELLGEFEELGVQVKDMDRGLLDFPAQVEGEDALLCWHVGEPRIAFWHSPQDGFAGRRPL